MFLLAFFHSPFLFLPVGIPIVVPVLNFAVSSYDCRIERKSEAMEEITKGKGNPVVINMSAPVAEHRFVSSSWLVDFSAPPSAHFYPLIVDSPKTGKESKSLPPLSNMFMYICWCADFCSYFAVDFFPT